MLMKNVYIGLKDRRNFDKIAVSVQKKNVEKYGGYGYAEYTR